MIRFSLLAAFLCALAPAAALAQAGALEPRVNQPLSADQLRGARTIAADNPALLAAEVKSLSDRLKQAEADIAQLRAQATEQADTLGKTKGAVAVISDKFANHTHVYGYETVKYWNHEYVTEGRPIVKDEKKEFGSFIESTPHIQAETGGPLLHK